MYSDITEIKQREQDLSEKSAALAALSSKLAKYLAPQVYDSIFTGQQVEYCYYVTAGGTAGTTQPVCDVTLIDAIPA